MNLDSAPEKKRAIGLKEKEKGLSGDDDQLKVSVSLHNETGNVFFKTISKLGKHRHIQIHNGANRVCVIMCFISVII